MPGQYQVFQSLAAIIAAMHLGLLGTRRCRRFTGISVQLSCRAWWSSPRFWAGCPCCLLHSPIHPKYVLWDYSLATLQAAPSWRHRPAEGNQGLPEHGEVWRYRLGSGSYHPKLCLADCTKVFRKMPITCRAHRWGICRALCATWEFSDRCSTWKQWHLIDIKEYQKTYSAYNCFMS